MKSITIPELEKLSVFQVLKNELNSSSKEENLSFAILVFGKLLLSQRMSEETSSIYHQVKQNRLNMYIVDARKLALTIHKIARNE